MDEAALFRMIDQMRKITETAAKERKRVRRDQERRSHLEDERLPVKLTPPLDRPTEECPKMKPFDDLEQW